MEFKRFISWLKKEHLLDTVIKNYMHFDYVLDESLRVNGEELLIIGDIGHPGKRVPALMTGCYALAAKRRNMGFKISLQSPKEKDDTADENMIEDMLCLDDGNVITLSLSGKLGSTKHIGKDLRKHVKQHNHRFISTVGLYSLPTNRFGWLVSSLDVDYEKMKKKGKRIKKLIDEGKEIHVTTRRGTDLYYDVKGMNAISNDGSYNQKGLGGNIPAGEVYVACRGHHVEGNVVIDGSIRLLKESFVLKKPVTLLVEKGEVVDIKGNAYAKELEKVLVWAHENSRYSSGVRMIGELGIGINPKAKIVGPTIINEKALGTAHVAIGSNAWFGGSIQAPIHLDQVLTEPMIKVDGKLLNGVLMKD